MSVITQDEVLSKKSGKRKRRKGMAALKKIRQALARRKLEMMQEEEQLREQIYDVFADDEDTGQVLK